MNLRQLRLFLAATDGPTITEVAERMDITQQGLSAAIARLESELGVRLLERPRRVVVLTPEGQRLAAGARRVIAEADAMLANLHGQETTDSTPARARARAHGRFGVPATMLPMGEPGCTR